MAMSEEPTSEPEARAWIAQQTKSADPFSAIAEATETHRLTHGCEAYASSDGPLLGVLARAVGADRILEVGTGLGYSAAWLAHGSSTARVDTIEADSSHAEAAQAQLQGVGLADRVQVHVGRSLEVLGRFEPGFDLVFYDAHIPSLPELERFHALLRSGGLLITSNLFLGQYDQQMPGLEEGARYRRDIFDPDCWLTTFADLKALSVRL